MTTPLIADPKTGHVRWTREGFRMMADAGLFADGRYELLEGEILKLMPNEPHSFVNSELVFLLANVFGSAYVRVPSSLAATADSEPEPSKRGFRREVSFAWWWRSRTARSGGTRG